MDLIGLFVDEVTYLCFDLNTLTTVEKSNSPFTSVPEFVK